MGESAAETVREIEDIRGRLENDLRELEQRLPAAAVWAKRAAGVAIGGGAAGTALLVGLRRLTRGRRKKKAREKEERRAAESAARTAFSPWADRLGQAFEQGGWKPWAAGFIGIWTLLRLAEIRQTKRLQRAILAGRS